MEILIRPARHDEVPFLEALIARSARVLGEGFYTSEETEALIAHVFGVDTQLIADGTYFVAEIDGVVAGCGGWSRRRKLFGGDRLEGDASGALDPSCEAAKIRAFFVDPAFARRGVGQALLAAAERAAREAGFTATEMMATLSGVPFYRQHGYRIVAPYLHPLPGGGSVGGQVMRKEFAA